jgi:hypothetical protein
MQDWINTHPGAMAVIVPLYVIVLITLVTSHITGWAALAKEYRLRTTFLGSSWRMQSAKMRFKVGYSNCLTVGANSDGLYLGTLFLIRLAHPPLFLPWREVAAMGRRKSWILGEFVGLQLGHELRIPFWIRDSLASKLKDAAGGHWPVESI